MSFFLSSLDGGAVSFTPRPLIQSPRYQANIGSKKKKKKKNANRNTIPRLFSQYFSYMSSEFPQTVSLAQYHRRLESTYFMSRLFDFKIHILWCVTPYQLVNTYRCVSSLLSFNRRWYRPFNMAYQTRIFINTAMRAPNHLQLSLNISSTHYCPLVE